MPLTQKYPVSFVQLLIGFKDVGLKAREFKYLNQKIQEGGARSYPEVVSLDAKSEIASAKAAVEIGVDYLLGGARVEDILPILSGSNIKYYPFPGEVIGDPSDLRGSIAEIVGSVKKLAAFEGVHGLDLLAYRSSETNVL